LGEVWPQLGDGTWRAFSFQKYIIFCRTSDDLVEILRVVHGARDVEGLFG
jgi:plasmid stabilization system protein ParE